MKTFSFNSTTKEKTEDEKELIKLCIFLHQTRLTHQVIQQQQQNEMMFKDNINKQNKGENVLLRNLKTP